jgi:small subunit ribosomal protein S6
MSKRNYKATFILDTRGYDEPVENIHSMLEEAVKSCGGEITETNPLGRKDFIRVTDKGHTGDFYLEIDFSGEPNVPADLQEKLRLEKRVKRVITISN